MPGDVPGVGLRLVEDGAAGEFFGAHARVVREGVRIGADRELLGRDSQHMVRAHTVTAGTAVWPSTTAT